MPADAVAGALPRGQDMILLVAVGAGVGIAEGQRALSPACDESHFC